MAMAIKGSKNYYRIQQIQRRHFINHAAEVGISRTKADELIKEITDMTENVSQKIAKTLPEAYPQRLAKKSYKECLNSPSPP